VSKPITKTVRSSNKATIIKPKFIKQKLMLNINLRKVNIQDGIYCRINVIQRFTLCVVTQ